MHLLGKKLTKWKRLKPLLVYKFFLKKACIMRAFFMSFISSSLELSLGRDDKYLNAKLHTITCLSNDTIKTSLSVNITIP